MSDTLTYKTLKTANQAREAVSIDSKLQNLEKILHIKLNTNDKNFFCIFRTKLKLKVEKKI